MRCSFVIKYILLLILFINYTVALASTTNLYALPERWSNLEDILRERHKQEPLKMKLSTQDITSLREFISTMQQEFVHLIKLQHILPKTTIEILRSIQLRNVDSIEAELIAEYLFAVPNTYAIANINFFDENTSHIIGREWHEIDYSGESMTWQEQQRIYAKFAISNFKTLANMQRFFPVESKLPYFNKIYCK